MENPHKFILLAPPALTRLIREVADEPGAAAVAGGLCPMVSHLELGGGISCLSQLQPAWPRSSNN